MMTVIRTGVSIPDDLFHTARQEAQEQNISFSQYVCRGIRSLQNDQGNHTLLQSRMEKLEKRIFLLERVKEE